MVALNETALELGLRRISRGCRVAATYSQGGTGIPAGEMNYPGAAAHMRPAAATGFRAVDATNGFGLSPNALNINGANTYQFVRSDPVDRVDPGGTNFWDYVSYIFTGQLGPAPTIPIYVVDRSGGVNTGLTGGHIDMVIPGQGIVGFYGRIPHGAGSGQQDGWNIPGFWNHTYQQFERNRPRYINPPRGAGCPHSSDSGYKSTIAAIRVAPAQLQEMLQELNSLEQHPGTFNIATNNCAENACKVLNAGGLNPDPWYDFGFDNPQGLIDQLQQGGATVFTGYTVENVNGQVTIIPAGQPPQP